MGRISTYPLGTNVTGQDMWIGTDVTDENATKNFTPDAVAEYFSNNAVIDSGLFAWKYEPYSGTSNQSEQTFCKIGFTSSSINIISLAGTIRVSNTTLSGTTPGNFILDQWTDKYLLLRLPNQPSSYGIYSVNSVTADGDFYLIDISFSDGRSALINSSDSLLIGFYQTQITPYVGSVFGRTGAVAAESGDYDTDLVTEATNKYFTESRAINSLLSGYSSSTGTISASDSILSAIGKLNGNLGIVSNLVKSDYTTNIFVGFEAGQNNTPTSPTQGRQNTFIGAGAGYDNTTGYATLNIGYASGYHNTTGTTNTNVGYQTGFNNITGSHNVNMGTDAGGGNLASDNMFIGFHTGGSVASPVITGTQNIFIGNESATVGGTMYNNVGIGYRNGFNITTGYDNVFLGTFAGFGLTTGYDNIFIGKDAGFSAIGATDSVYIGFRSGYYATNSYNQTAVGTYALFNSTGNTNLGFGYSAGFSVTTGSNNTFLGYNAGNNGSQKVDVTDSVVIGAQSYSAHNEVIVIGQGAFSTKASQAVLGSASITETVLRGVIVTAGYPTYADNAAAVSGGLAVNSQYKTATGELRIVV